MAIIKRELPLVFQYIQISSPIPFYIYGSDNEKARRLLPSNAYVLRSAELLTSEKAPNQPIWKVFIEYDDTLLTDGRIVEINGFNVDFSKYLETFGGQLVRLGDDQFQDLYRIIKNSNPITYYNGNTGNIVSFGNSFTFKGYLSFTGTLNYYEDEVVQTANYTGNCYGEYFFVKNGNTSYYIIPMNDLSKFAEVLVVGEGVKVKEFVRLSISNINTVRLKGSVQSVKEQQ